MNLTKRVNIFNQTVREIRCIASEHDYLGDGELFVEEDLEVGKLYTMIHGRTKSYGRMVFLKELPSRFGYQAYLFEELEPYDEDLYFAKSREWLIKELKKGEGDFKNSRHIGGEKMEKMMERIGRHEKYDPHFTEGHDQGNAYWIVPVAVRDSHRIEYSDITEFRQHKISIPGQYFDSLLTDFFTDGIDPELSINTHRYSTDDVSEGLPIYGFEWYLNPNFYTYGDIRQILERMQKASDMLRSGNIDQLPSRQKNRLRKKFAAVAEDESDMTYKDAMNVTADYYDSLSDSLKSMMEQCPETDLICVTAP